MVRKGWFRTLEGTVLSSASIVSMLLRRDTNSRLSSFSDCMSPLSGLSTKFTWHREARQFRILQWRFTGVFRNLGKTYVCYVIQTAEDVLSGLFGFKPRLFLVFFRCLRKTGRLVQISKAYKFNAGCEDFCRNVLQQLFEFNSLPHEQSEEQWGQGRVCERNTCVQS